MASQAPQAAGKFLNEPLITDIYTADPSAHVFNGRIFIYPSHDIDAGVKPDDLGSHFAMRDYHVLSMDRVGGKVTDHGVALDIKDVPWAGRQMWAPDAAEKGGRYYLYFPVKDKEDAFRIGVAVGSAPQGPFKAQPAPIKGTFASRRSATARVAPWTPGISTSTRATSCTTSKARSAVRRRSSPLRSTSPRRRHLRHGP